MIRERVVGYRERVQAQFRAALAQDQPPQDIGGSVAISVFVTTLPTLGTGLIVLAAIGYRFAWANRLALFAPVVVLNPIVKTGVYASSFGVGTLLLGPLSEDIIDPTLTLTAGREIVVRLLLGNAILAVVFALVGYVLVVYAASSVPQSNG